jgi:hypothetical protein
MEHNVGTTDRTVRLGAGAVAGAASLGILANAVPLPTIASPVLGVAALILLATGTLGTCGLYSILGVDTN